MNKKKLISILILVLFAVAIIVVVCVSGNSEQGSGINKSGYEVSSSSNGKGQIGYRDPSEVELRLRELSFSGIVDENRLDGFDENDPTTYPGYMLTVDWIRNDYSKGFLLKNTNNFENDTYGYNQGTMVSVDETMTACIEEYNTQFTSFEALQLDTLNDAGYSDYVANRSEEIPLYTPYTIEKGIEDYNPYVNDTVTYNPLVIDNGILICDCNFKTSLGVGRVIQWYDSITELYHIVCILPYSDNTRLFKIEVLCSDSTNLLNAIIDLTNDGIVILGGT